MLIAAWYLFTDFNPPALRRLIRRDFALRELPSLIEDIFSCKKVHDAIRRLPTDDAQAFIDVIDEARCSFTHLPSELG